MRVSSSSNESTDEAREVDQEHLVPRASYDNLKEELETAHETIRQRDIRIKRLQSVYQAKSAEFREATASVLGLKLNFYPNGQVRVTSVYDLSCSFVFQPNKKPRSMKEVLNDPEGLNVAGKNQEEGMKMQLIAAGEGGPDELQGLMNTWIRDEMCIPCFLASVTLECFDKWKMEQREAAVA